MKRILWCLLILLALVAGGCGYNKSINDPITEPGTTPVTTGGVTGMINYTVPNNGDTGIVNDSLIYIIFNQSLDVKTVIPSFFPVVCGTIAETVSVAYDAATNTVKITPTDGFLTSSSVCKVTAKGTSLRNSSGILLGSDYVFSFTTASGTTGGTVPITTPLTVDFTVPIDNATGVTVSEPFYMIFNKTLNPLTVSTTSFSAACGGATSQTPVSGIAVKYDSANKAVVVTPPTTGWPGGQVCKVTARAPYVMDSASVALASNLVFTFSTGVGGVVVGTTVLAVDYAIPIPPANQIAVDSDLTFVFNKALNAITVVPTAFTASCDSQIVNGIKVTNNTANNSIKLSPPSAGWGNGALCDITIKKDSLWAADSQNMLADYIYSFSTITTSGRVVNRLALSANKYSVKSTGTDQATITVKALDANGATIPEVAIALSTDRGEISASSVTTDEFGKATFSFNADTTRANGVATITASSGVVTPVSLPITIAGTTLVLTSNKSVTKTGLPDDITLTGMLKDADNIPMVLSDVSVTSSLSNTLKDVATSVTGPTFKTNSSGTFILTYSAVNTGTDTITATGFGATGIATLTVTNSTFAFIAPLPNAVVNTEATQSLTVHWTNDSGTAVAGNITFSATNGFFAGGLKTQTVPTDALGNATVTYTASNIASPDTITATAIPTTGAPLETILPLDIRANNPTQLYVQATSTVIAIKTPGNSPTSTIIATVLDPIGNPVAGKSVSFSLVKGAGGGEYLSPATAVTDSAGQAKTTFYSGTAASLQNGVTLRASIDAPILTDTVDLTISGAAASIVFGTTNKIGSISVDNYQIAYELPIAVLVTDINGGPIANRSVSIGIYPTQFRTGVYSDVDTSWMTTAVFANEDLNRNAILDLGEDANGNEILDPGEDANSNGILDVSEDGAKEICAPSLPCANRYYHNGSEGQAAEISDVKEVSTMDTKYPLNNGRLDPRNIATAPMEVITDANGLAVVKIIYPKSYCNWVTVELSATTQVSGTETRALYNTNLSCMKDDPPYSSSPFGY